MASQFLMPVRQVARMQRMPMDPLQMIQRDMERLVGNLVGTFANGEDRAGQFALTPRIDVSETATGLVIEAELPGAIEHEVEVSLDRNELLIAGEIRREHSEEQSGYRIAERQVGRFKRVITLPFEPDPDKVGAQFRNGLLTVNIARPALTDGPKRIALTSMDRGEREEDSGAEATGEDAAAIADSSREPTAA